MFSWMGLLEASAAGGICIAVFFLASQLFGERYRAGYRKIVWLLIAIRMCIPVSASLFPAFFTVQIPVVALGERESGQQPEGTEGNFSYGTQSPEKNLADTAPDKEGKNKGGQEGGKAAAGRQFTSQDVLTIVWGCGSIAVLLYYLMGHLVFCRKVMKKSIECREEEILTAAAETAGEMGLGYVPRIRYVKGVQTGPFTMGFFRNTIVLPERDCRKKDVQYILRHELAHCAARDTRLKVLFLAVSVIHWFNPFVWLMKAMVDQDMELACDERALADTSREERSEYSEVLMSWIGSDRAARSALSTGYVQGVRFIKKRFRNIFNMQKKSGRAAVCIFVAFLMAVSGAVGFEAGRTVYAGNKITIDSGIELRTDVTGDGLPDQVQVRDHNDLLTTSLTLRASDGREAQFTYDEELWASSWLTCGDLSGNGAADIVLLRTTFGMHGDGPVSVLHVTEDEGKLVWQEYPENFIPNPDIEKEQPDTFERAP